MWRFVARRTLWAVFLFVAVTFVTYIIFFVAPNDPAKLAAGKSATPEQVEQVAKYLNLDKPVWEQYGLWFKDLVVHGSLGRSFVNQRDVKDIVLSAAPVTASLVLGGAVLWLLVSIPIGVLSAVKLLERFRQEARAVAKLSHPNVVAVIDAGEDGGHPYIVFEYVEGETLKQRIARLGALDAQEALAYAIEIARGLTVAHARNMVHRDIKPQNVLIDAEGRAKLTDFGISRQLEQDGMTATGRVLGTTDYVAPEQAMGHPVDIRSDIYSLGVVLYEMLVGQVPFQRRQPGRGGDETRQRGAARRAAAAAGNLRGDGAGG